ncbi:MAG: M3 family metallopeptidase [Bacteroidales bacterium]|nr:M3 family metallopeptidase [Bacteroidales bacterium]
MKKIILTMCSVAMLMISGCSKKEVTNPLLTDWDTPFQTVPFESIKTSDYEPAFTEAIKIHNKEIDSIVNNTDKPTFDNTVAALDYSGRLLTRVTLVYENMIGCNTNDSLQKLQEKISPMLSDHEAEIKLNEKLFNRIKTVWDNRSKMNLNEEQEHLLKKTYDSFVRGGALLDKEKKEQLKKINQQLVTLNDKYNANVLAETKNYKLVITDKEDLKGLPQWLVDNAAATAKEQKQDGKWIFTLDNSSVLPFLTYCDNRSLRKQIFDARINRGNNGNQYDNNKITEQILHLRAEMANLLGYDNFASWQLEDRMAKTPRNADSILENCLKYAVKAAENDIKQFQAMLSQDEKGATLEGWDMYYYAEKLKKQKYDFDEQQTRPYFEIENVKQGCFDNITKLYGLTFTKLDNIQTYADDVDVYEVKNSKGEHAGILYFDAYIRGGKSGGAWCTAFTPQYKKDGKRIDPIIQVCFNYAKQNGRTTLTADEALTVFHEMGHATNEFLSDGTYPSTSGTNVPTDFVELPSQLAEHWCMQPEVLKTYAKNADGEVIPQEIINKMQRAENFNQGFMFGELLAAAWLDMQMHKITKDDTVSLQEFETKAMQSIHMPKQIPPRYRSTYFTHIFGGGYSAGYYCYTWSEMLDADAFVAWKETGDIFNKEVSGKFANYVLSHGGTNDAAEQYRRFRGKDPDMKYLLIQRGMQ